MSKRNTIESIKDYARKCNYKVLDNKYISVKTYMKFECLVCGTIVSKTLDNFKTHHNCPTCENTRLNNKWDIILNKIINISKTNNKIIPISKLKDYGIDVSEDNIRDILHRKGYKTYPDFCLKNNIHNEDIIINGNYIPKENLTINNLKLLWEECKEKYNVILGADICNKYCKEWHIPSWRTIQNVLKKNSYTLDDFYTYVGIHCHFKDKSKYNKYLNLFINVCNTLNRTIHYNELNDYNKWNLPSVRWFIINCPNKNIKNYNQFLEWIGFIPNYDVNKDTAIKAIMNMQKKLNRPLMYDDFRNPQFNEIGIGTIKKMWGSMNKMKLELNLEVNQEDMVSKTISIEQAKEDIKVLCDYIYNTENRKIIITTDTDKINNMLNFDTYRKYFKNNNEDIRSYIDSLGFQLQKEGRGLTYYFEDGEITKSKYELDFSNYLRNELNLRYNVDYFRDVKYKTFIDNYNRNMDCDYIINYNGKKIYIEIAGLLRDLHKYYYGNKKINSKSKEEYRLKLIKKEEMLKSINCEYYLLFPINKNYKSILDFDNINNIFNK